MPVRFPCQHCGQRLSVTSRKIGARARCPNCQQVITIPDADRAAEMLQAARASADDNAPEDPFAEFVVYDDTDLVYESPEMSEATQLRDPAVDPNRVAVHRNVLYAQGVLLAVVALICFVLGILVGNGRRGGDEQTVQQRPAAIHGRVEYLTISGSQVPDEGSVVIVVPDAVRPDEKLAIEGLRPNEPPPAENHPSLVDLDLLGGAYARTGTDGRFRLQVPKDGEYRVLLLSRNMIRDTAKPLPRTHLAEMGRYFVPADELIGDSQYRWELRPIRREETLEVVFRQ